VHLVGFIIRNLQTLCSQCHT